MPRPRGSSASSAERVRRHRARKQAVLDVVAGRREGQELACGGSQDEIRLLTAQADAVRRLEGAAARRVYTAVLEENAEVLARRMVGLAMDGDISCLIAVSSRLAPPARAERRLAIPDFPPLGSLEGCRLAERRVAEALAVGRIDVNDALAVSELVGRIADGHLRAARDRLLREMQSRLDGGDGIRVRLRELLVCAGGAGTGAGSDDAGGEEAR